MKTVVNNASEYKKILSKNLYMCIATATVKGEPWISQVYFVTNAEGNFYWYSSQRTRHSQLIERNDKVALSLYDSTAIGNDVYGIYAKATCSVVTDRKELIAVLRLYAQKMLKTGFVGGINEVATFVKRFKDFLGNSELRLYKAVPYEISKLGESTMFNGKYIDRREILCV